jgi:hypothetical protein
LRDATATGTGPHFCRLPRMNIDFVLPVDNLTVRVHSPVRKARDWHGRQFADAHAGEWWKVAVPAIEQCEVVDAIVQIRI